MDIPQHNPGFPIREEMIAIFNCMGDGVITCDLEARILRINPAAVAISGWQVDEVVGRLFEEIFPISHRESGRPVVNLIKQVINEKVTTGLPAQSVLTLKNGDKRYISASIAPILDALRNTTGVVIVFRDITRIKNAEEAVRAERNTLRTVIESVPIGMVLVDSGAIIQQTNKAFTEMLALNYADTIKQKLGNGMHCQNSLERGCGNGEKCRFCDIRKTLESVLKSGEACHDLLVQNTFLVSGEAIHPWYRMNFVPITLAGESHVIIVANDVTEQIQYQDQLIRAKESCLKMMADFPVMIWRTNRLSESDYFNHTWLQFTGIALEEALSGKWIDTFHPEDQGWCYETVTQAYENRVSFEMEHRLRRFDGEYRWVLCIGTPYFDLEDQFAGYIGSVFDITERKRTEDSLKRFQLLAENARDIILFVEPDGRIIDANKAAVKAYGYTYEELTQLTVYNLRNENQTTAKDLEVAYREGMYFETVHIRKDRTTFPVEVNSQGTTLFDKRLVLSIIRDISERKRAETLLRESQVKYELKLKQAKEEAEAANVAKSVFLANMSHEIRTPINGMIGMIDLTLLTKLSDVQIDNLVTAKACANSLLKIVNDILDFSKMEAGKLVIEKVGFDLKELIEDLIKTHAVQAHEKGLELQYTFSSAIPRFLKGDPTRLQQILNNLVHNAVKFTDQGEVKLSIRKVAENNGVLELKFAVADTGIGIAPEEMPKLFKTFSQIDGSFTKRFGGTGLGLVITKQLVEIMGGMIWVESEKGRGSTFSFTLRFETGEPVAKATSLPHFTKANRSQSLLLVEDDPVNQAACLRMLKEKGHHVDTADNGLEAVRLCKDHQYDAILMDIQMPQMDGVIATQKIREIEGPSRHTPIIAVTAFALSGDRERFLSLGMDAYISKPVQMDQLFRILDAFLEQQISAEAFDEQVYIGDNGELVFKNGQNNGVPGKLNDFLVSGFENNLQALNKALSVSDPIQAELGADQLKEIAETMDFEELKTLIFKIELALRKEDYLKAAELAGKVHEIWEMYKKMI